MFQKNRSFFTHPNLQTHPNLPKGKEQITPHIDINPHLASPEGEGQTLLWLIIRRLSTTRVTCIHQSMTVTE